MNHDRIFDGAYEGLNMQELLDFPREDLPEDSGPAGLVVLPNSIGCPPLTSSQKTGPF